MRRLIKFLHELGATGVTGAFAACIVLEAIGPTQPGPAFVASRQAVAGLTHWMLMPALAAVIISGLLAIVANRAYMDAGWAWIKAVTGITLFEGTLLNVAGTAEQAAKLAASGLGDPAELARLVHTERNSLWVLLAVCLVNVILAVWRPRILRLPK